jgi:hypothetical protein
MILNARSLGAIALLCALAACNSSSGSSANTLPNASTTLITLTTSTGAPLSGLTVVLSTGITKGEPSGMISSARTDSAGQATFMNLPSVGQLCVSSSTTVGGHLYRTNHCAYPFPAHYTLKYPKMPI